ncbi:Protein GrpE [Buchnera aphidicola (Pterocallis alni)]|uniref:nucleotide exchange factor GrpE n=1 Tax=Buchnera aphidicola TaxID=9 RepID=UPI0034646F9C
MTINDIKNIKCKIIKERKNISLLKKKKKKYIKDIFYRIKKDMNNINKYYLSDIIKSILPSIDSLEKAIELSIKDAHVIEINEKLKKIIKSFINLFKLYHIDTIDKIHVNFDPSIHQAISLLYVKNIQSNYVVNVLQKGYKLHNRLLRPAMVIVSQ